MRRLALLTVLLGAAATSGTAEASFFNWRIIVTDTSVTTTGIPKIVVLSDYPFVADFETGNKDWSCKVSKPDGSNFDWGPGVASYQEGTYTVCTLRSNKAVTARGGESCRKWTKGFPANKTVENSGDKVSVTGPSGVFSIELTCSADTWKSQGIDDIK